MGYFAEPVRALRTYGLGAVNAYLLVMAGNLNEIWKFLFCVISMAHLFYHVTKLFPFNGYKLTAKHYWKNILQQAE